MKKVKMLGNVSADLRTLSRFLPKCAQQGLSLTSILHVFVPKDDTGANTVIITKIDGLVWGGYMFNLKL